MGNDLFLQAGVKTEMVCTRCGKKFIAKYTQVGEFNTVICPDKNCMAVVFYEKIANKKTTEKKQAKLNIKNSQFIVGRNKDLQVELGRVYNEDNRITFSRMDDNSIDLILTSPPYDGLREYRGQLSWDYRHVISESFRVLKPGRILVWNVNDEVKDGSESGSSFRHALFALDEIGFKLHDTMIFQKQSPAYPAHEKSNRYSQVFEFVFILVKGDIKVYNLIKDKKNHLAGKKNRRGIIEDVSIRENIWQYTVGSTSKDNKERFHEAMMPLALAADHIYSWSNEGDIVYDPFGGAGTTAKAAISLNRKWILSEIIDEYAKLTQERLSYNLFGDND
jgi:site-specific DNA-methyltransferase (adenine-specific)